MAVLGLDHVQLAIPEGGEDNARSFYRDVLGMREVAKPNNLSPKGCWFESGSLSLHLGVDQDFRPARKAHPALLVDDLEATKTSIKNAGHAIKEALPIGGCNRFFSEDPFGNRIEFMQKISEYFP